MEKILLKNTGNRTVLKGRYTEIIINSHADFFGKAAPYYS